MAQLSANQIKELQTRPAIPPELPPEVVSFNCTAFGVYRGENYNQHGGEVVARQRPISELEAWLTPYRAGSEGSEFTFYDAAGVCIAKARQPAFREICDLIWKGRWPAPVLLTLSKAPRKGARTQMPAPAAP